MANARFIYTDWVRAADASVIVNTVGNWLVQRPAEFILSPWRKKVARSTGSPTDVDLVVDLKSARSFNCAFLIQPKIHVGGSVKIQANATNVWTSPSFDSGAFPAIDAQRRLTGLYFAAQNYRYVRVLWVNTGVVSQEVELGYLMLGTYYEPTYNLTDKLSRTPNDPSVINEAYDGEVQVFRKTKFRTVNFFFEAMPLADRNACDTMYDEVGIGRHVIFATDSALLNDTFYGRFLDWKIDFHTGSYELWDLAGQFSEAR